MNSQIRRVQFFVFAWCVLMAVARADVFSLSSLGALPPGAISIKPNAISPDGTLVAGTIVNSASVSQAFVWTSSSGFVGLGDLPGGNSISTGLAISAGGTVVGSSDTSIGSEAFRWTETDGMMGLGYLGPLPGGGGNGSANAISADGSVTVGISSPGSQGFRWTEADGMVPLGNLGGSLYSNAKGVSADGTVIAGIGNGPSGTEAFRWTESDGMVGLGDLPGGIFSSSALAISTDGQVIVGRSTSGQANNEAFRWTSGEGMVGLGFLPNTLKSSVAYATSGDGSVIVGDSSTLGGQRAFLWTVETGMVDLKEYLVSHGVTGLNQWILKRATAVSSDGRTIVGWGNNGLHSEGWIVTIPEPSTFVLVAFGILPMLLFAARRCLMRLTHAV